MNNSKKSTLVQFDLKIKSIVLFCMFFITCANLFSQTIQYSWAIKQGSATSDQAFAVDADNVGNSYVCGAFTGTVDFDPGAGIVNLTSAGSDDIYLMKVDPSGNLVWVKNMGGTASDVALAITLDGSNNVLITGHFTGTADFDPSASTYNLIGAGGLGDIFIAKYDNNGNFIWADGIGSATGANEQGSSIITDPSGNVYVSGYFWGTTDFNPGAGTNNLTSAGVADIFALKLDASGNYVWANRFGSTGDDDGRALTIDATGNVYLTGYFQLTVDFDPGAGTANLASGGWNDIFVAKYDNNGIYSWANRFGSGTSSVDVSFSVQTDASNNVYMAGQFSNTVDFDPGAGTANLVSAGGTDIVVAKYNTSGAYIWAKRMGGTGNDIATLLCQDASGNVYSTGNFQNTADFDPGAGTVNLVSSGVDDIFLSKLDASGNYLWAGKMGGVSSDYSYSVCTGPYSTVWVAGSFQGTADFDPSASSNNLVSSGSYDGFLEKFCATSSSSINVAACDSYLSPSGNYTWTISGAYNDTIANAAGCDSIITVNLTITAVSNQSSVANPNPVCPGSSSTVTMASSQSGINYSLINNTTSAVADGPFSGTGAAMNFNTGALSASTSFNIVGDPLSGISLPVTNDHARYSTPFFAYSNKITVESWVYFDGINLPWAGQSTAAADNMATNVWLWHAGTFYVNDNGTWRALTFPAVSSTGWKHVATVANATGLYIYYDGVLVASNATGITSGIRNNAASIIDLGHDPRFVAGTPGRNNNLGFDNFMVWDTDRNITQINSDKNNCLYGNESGLVLYTRMNEGSGTVISSITGSSANIINPSASNWITGSGVCPGCSKIVSTVTVNVQDNTPPVTPTISNATGECSVTPTAPTTTDNCAGTVTGTTPTVFPVTSQGTTVVTWTFADGNGNSTTAAQNIIIDDVTAPVISNCPGNISVNADQSGCTANVNWTAPTGVDNCVGTVTPTSTNNPNDNFALGITTVTYTFNDGNGNQSVCSFTVEVVNNLNGSSVDQMVSCNGGSDGAIDATITGGTSPYTVNWTGPSGFNSTTEDISGLFAGTYTPSVTDANGCTLTGSVVITEPSAISISLDGSTDPTACGVSDGTASVTVTGGTVAGAYNYSWTDGGAYNSTNEDPSDFPAGAFTLTVTDDNGCTENLTVTFSDPNGPTVALASSAVTSLNCNGDTNGDAQVDVTLNGGATSATYLWDDINTTITEDLSNVGAGTYTIEVTDNNNCVATLLVTISEPLAISGSTIITDVTCNGDNNGSIDLTASGGTGALTFLWDDASTSTTEDISGLSGGNYSVIITDGNGCTDTFSATVNEPAVLSASGVSTNESLGNDGTIDLTVTGGTSSYTFAWTGPGGFTSSSEDLSGLAGGTYDVTVTDANGCTTTTQVIVISTVGIFEWNENSFAVFPNPTNGVFTVKINSADNIIEIMDVTGRKVITKNLTSNLTAFDLSAMENGVYFVHVKNGNGVKTIRVVLQK